ncbi:uncharacterized protein KQ657_000914 [Scheffersomyces spartinae]|uniref:YMC020W-like alpha/beta hydrolase domain-containing protein n=1 Tax=Scheffersomyces spartinae TaxID=45513 RepID=A0A9P7V8T3_9ASCO|nr:uncharacterized protein KQ657_000914 [Scheffersomyces spartinae]KAG7193160.1 hypothetical protein KQ657_000914 [Scheffersomyces spartinae]
MATAPSYQETESTSLLSVSVLNDDDVTDSNNGWLGYIYGFIPSWSANGGVLDRADSDSGRADNFGHGYGSNGGQLEAGRILVRKFRLAVENSKGSVNYGIYFNGESGGGSEMALSDSITETSPIYYKLSSSSRHPSSKATHRNRIVPSMAQTYRDITWVTNLRLWSEKLVLKEKTSECHLYARKNIEHKLGSIKRILIIGVHGYLPSKFVKSHVGDNNYADALYFTRSSRKMMETWLRDQGKNPQDYIIDCVALEGQGRHEKRFVKLCKLLANWKSKIESSDFIYVVGHCHATIVAASLLAHILNTYSLKSKHIPVGFLSIAGINIGPIVGLDSKLVIRAYSSWENEVINELFELQKPTSKLSQRYVKDLEILVNHNVKITFCGSLTDQFVPLMSSLACHLLHPNIYRFAYVEKSGHVPPFLVTLGKLILVIKNLGHSDYDLLREYSQIMEDLKLDNSTRLSPPLIPSSVPSSNRGGGSRISSAVDYNVSRRSSTSPPKLNSSFSNKAGSTIILPRSATTTSNGTGDHGKTFIEEPPRSSDRFVDEVEVDDGLEHWNIQHDDNVYYAGIKHALETTSLKQSRGLRVSYEMSNTKRELNLFHLPWDLRLMINELMQMQNRNFHSLDLIRQLVSDYHLWQPTQKHWKDIKMCFNGVGEIDIDELIF